MGKLKCWKKLGRDIEGLKEWSKEDDKYSYAKVLKTGLKSDEIKKRGIKPHIFLGRIGRGGKTIKEYFKKDKEAVDFADKYMEKNDKC